MPLLVPESRSGGTMLSRAAKRGVPWRDVALIMLSLTISTVLTFDQIPTAPVLQFLRVASGLVNVIVAPGLVIIALLYPAQEGLSPLLRWVLVLSTSCAFDVVLALLLSVTGVHLTSRTVSLGESGCLFVLGLLLVHRRRQLAVETRRLYKSGFPRAQWPFVTMGLGIFTTVVIWLTPNLYHSQPAIFLTNVNGRMSGPSYGAGGTVSSAIQVHVTNPQALRGLFVLRRYLGRVQYGGTTHLIIGPQGSWSETFRLPHRPSGLRMTFVLVKANDPSFRRVVWLGGG